MTKCKICGKRMKLKAADGRKNFVAPRLTELAKHGVVEPIGKTTCRYTGHRVTVWGLYEREGARA